MSFLQSYPATSMFFAVAIFAVVAGWALWKWGIRSGANRSRLARYLFAGGVVQIVITMITTGMNIAQGNWRVDYHVFINVFIGLAWCWIAWSALRKSPGNSQSGNAETPSFPER